jgi:hypothetical protein
MIEKDPLLVAGEALEEAGDALVTVHGTTDLNLLDSKLRDLGAKLKAAGANLKIAAHRMS